MVINLIAAILLLFGIPMLLNLRAEDIAADIMEMLRPKSKLREQIDDIQEHKENRGLYALFYNLHAALENTGNGKLFPATMLAIVVFFIGGIFICFFAGNLWLLASVPVGMAMIPFGYITSTVNNYKKHLNAEMEMALSNITSAYLRSGNIITAVRENTEYIKPPLKSIFLQFVGDATAISSNTKSSLYKLRGKVDSAVWYDWCTALVQCQDDSTMMDNLNPIVAKLTDIRLVNDQIHNTLMNARVEYISMVLLLVASPIAMYFVKREWFDILAYSGFGKVIIGICAFVILVTGLLVSKYTQRIEYRK